MNTQTTAAPQASAGEYLSFRLGREEYGIPILTVQEIRGYQEPTRIANSPPFMKGVVNLRGVIVPIVDLRIKFAQEPSYNEITATIVLNIGKRVIGIVVDSVSDVIALTAEQIKPPPQLASGIDTAYVTGIATLTQGDVQRMLILVDIERLMSSDELGLLEAVAT
ncbi:chemotaxis protein CheW [Hydrogenophaga sp. OTU3427]|uniref:chemotaxis protein CheW n=1 Tax=Hydrogenophaga sp. OTU3427 TaxID=3043856 RepID=UPI00313F16C1